MPSRFLTYIAALTLFLGFGLFAGAASAQSDADLRRENDALRSRANDLEAELKAARERIKELEKSVKDLESQIARMNRQPSTGGTPTLPPIEEEKVTVDESIPEASPRALMNAMKQSYSDAVGDLTMGAAGSKERNVYLKQTDNWVSRINREHRKQITWAVRVQDVTVGARGAELLFQAVDPVTDVFLGPEFPVRITNRSIVRRIQDLGQANQLIKGKFEVKGVLMPEVRLNSNREAAGTFDNPPLIGPFAEFQMTVEVQSMRPFEEAKADKPNTPERPGA